MTVHGGNIRLAAERYGLRADSILDFSANINPLGLTGKIKKVLADSLDSIRNYPDPECKTLRYEVADFLDLQSRHILIGNGSTELIYLIPKVLAPHRILIVIPTFSEYESSAKQQRSEIIFVRRAGEGCFKVEIENLVRLIPRSGLVFICNPNNPTGDLLSKDEIMYLAKAARRQSSILVIDEAFIEFIEEENAFSVVREAAKASNLLVLRSLTKFFALPGLRLGYVTGNKDLIDRLSGYQFPWNVNCLAQIAGREVIKDKSYIRQSKDFAIKERKYLFERLKNIKGLAPYQPTANFILCRLGKGLMDSKKLCGQLGSRGILVRDCGNFRGLDNRYVRIAVRKREENIKLISALTEIFR